MRNVFLCLLLTLVLSCFWASNEIALWSEWTTLKTSPWFLVTLLDLYIGLTVFGLFTFFIRRSLSHSLLWGCLFFSLGNIGTLLWTILNWRHINERLKYTV